MRERAGEPGAERARGRAGAKPGLEQRVKAKFAAGASWDNKKICFQIFLQNPLQRRTALYHTWAHTRAHTRTRSRTHANIHTDTHAHTRTCSHTCTHSHTWSHAHTHSHAHTYNAHTHSHTLMHTHTLTHLTFALANRLPCIMTEKMRSHSHALGDCLRVRL